MAALLFASPLAAEITIQIDRGYDNPKKIGVVPFGVGAGVQGVENPNAIIAFDLARSGQFAPTPPENMLSMPTTPKDVLFRDWRVLGVEYVVIGRTEVAANGNLSVSYYLFDVLNERQLANETFTAPPTALRDMAHLVSDAVYEKLTGIPGAFSTRIIYVLARDLGTKDVKFNLEMADADGARPRTLLESREPILSATWSPDGKKVAYVSFEGGKPSIILQEIATGQRTKLTDFPGLNSAPAFSPDGKQLALVLSRDGDPEIYTMNLATRELKRITRQRGIDTEPSWTADGKSRDLHVRSWRQTADLSDRTRNRTDAAFDVRRRLQRARSNVARRQTPRVRAPQRRRIPHRGDGPRTRSIDGAHVDVAR